MTTQILMRDDPKGDVTVQDGLMQVVFRRRYNKPVEKVWAALTIPERLEDWFGAARIDLRPGGSLRLDFSNGKSMQLGITRVEPPHFLGWSWEIDGHDTSILFELQPDGDGCLLTLTHKGIGAHGWGTGVRAGWHAHLAGLADALDGKATSWDVKNAREEAVSHLYPPLD